MRALPTSSSRSGFTLLEMGIVLLAVGMVIGGISMGKNMIRGAQLRNTMGDAAKYTQAFNNFITKYHLPPGDLNTATSFWANTSNGDGNGQIGGGGMTVSGTTITSTGTADGEVFGAWQQLFVSGLVNGSTDSPFSGTGTGSGGNNLGATIGTNVPATSLSNGGWTVMFQNVPTGGDTYHFSVIYNHVLFLGTVSPNSFTYGPLLTPAEASGMDAKMDDGLPGSGTIQAFKTGSGINPNCTTSSTQYNTGSGNTTPNVAACGLMFITNF